MANDRKRSALPDEAQDAPEIDMAEEATPAPAPAPAVAPPPPARAQAPIPSRQWEQPSLSVERPSGFPQPPTRKRKDDMVEQELQSQQALRAAISRSSSTPPALYLMLLALIGGTGYMGYKFYFSGRKLARTGAPATAAPVRSPTRAETSAPPQAHVVVPKATVVVETDMIGFEVFANEEPVQLFNNRFELPAGEVALVFKRAGYEDFLLHTRLQPGETRFLQPAFVQEKRRGFLTYETVPSAKLTLYQGDKAVFEMTTPFEGQSVPVGKYKAVLVNDLIGFRSEEEIQVQEWKTTSVRRQLQGR